MLPSGFPIRMMCYANVMGLCKAGSLRIRPGFVRRTGFTGFAAGLGLRLSS